jgi:adenylate cyclase
LLVEPESQPAPGRDIRDFPLPENETARLQALESYQLVGTPTECAFDELSEVVAQICACPIGYVSLMADTHDWLKGQYGIAPADMEPWPRNVNFCATTICQSDLLVVPDAREDSRFCEFPSVTDEPYFRFYAGMPLINPEGYALGTLCVLDFERRDLTFEQAEMMRFLSRQVIAQLELRRKVLQLEVTQRELTVANEQSEVLLNNILPSSVAEELKRERHVQPRYYNSVTIMFTDFKDFTLQAERMEPRRLVDDLDFYFCAFDEIIARHRLEKLKTIGDAYMCVGGLPEENRTHATDACSAALEIQAFMARTNRQREKIRLAPWEVRIGIHTGSVMAGVVGKRKFAYDIWGDAVNVAARMEAHGEAERVNLSENTHHRVKEHFHTEHRGSIEVKNKGVLDMYFLSPIEV